MLIIQAPPGAGKSTVLPLELLHEPWLKGKKIVMLEPRRLAARSVAARMSALLGEDTGETVGYRMRFENRISGRTKIEVVTEGILIRMMQNDNSLGGTGILIFDEFHERSLSADLSLALALQVQDVLRNDLRILIMSATLDGDKLSAVLGNIPVITSKGKQFPVMLKYLGDDNAPVPQRMVRAILKALREQEGDVLAFFPGTGEIHRTAELLQDESINAKIQPLYGDLPFIKQQEAILPDPSGRRKIVLATSIAETSLTIEGIKTVVDSGFSRVPRFNLRTGLTRLETVRVTRDSADQRAGRAGRLGPGTCYRLWSEGSHIHLSAQRNPEILDADITPLLLEIYQWGIKDVEELKWITLPPAAAVTQAKAILQQLGALKDNRITERGKAMLRFPTHPRIAHMLLEAIRYDEKENKKNYAALASDLAALLEERDPLPKESGTDITLRVEILRKWRKKEKVNADRNVLERIERLSSQWRKLMKTAADNSAITETDAGVLIASAYPERIARRMDQKSECYRLAGGQTARLPVHDPLSVYEWLAVAHLDAGSNEGKIFMAAPMDADDALSIAEEKEVLGWDEKNNSITAVIEKCVGSITVKSIPLKNFSNEKRVKLWCEVIRKEGLELLNLPESFENWRTRMLCIKKWRPDEEWPDVSDEKLLNMLEEWLGPLLEQAKNKKDLELLDAGIFKTMLSSYDFLNRLEKLAPAALKVPSGSMIGITYYTDGRTPELHVRIQEIFGMKELPAINEGKIKMKLFLLSPARRSVQVTQDLESFWKNTYPEIRKELKIRYPKHYWPENPLTAEAVRGIKKSK